MWWRNGHGLGKVHLLDQISYMYGDRKIETVYASLTNIKPGSGRHFPAILTFEGGTEVWWKSVLTIISPCRDGMYWEDGTAVIRDWRLNGEIIRKTGMTEETVVPVKTAAGLMWGKTMAPRQEDTIVKEDLPKVSEILQTSTEM